MQFYYGTEYPPQEIVDKLMSPEWYFDVPENEIFAVRWLKQMKKEMDEIMAGRISKRRSPTDLNYHLIRSQIDSLSILYSCYDRREL